jgi:peptide/nickel transport system permease protein
MFIRRLLSIVPLLLLVSLLVFSLTALLPGDPAKTLAGANAPAQKVEELRTQLGLDAPLLVRYGRWLAKAVQGDLGTSLFTKRPVTTEIASRLPVTAAVVAGALLFSIPIGLLLGIVAARRPGGVADHVATGIATLGVAIPHFVLGILLIAVMSIWLGLLPIAGYVPVARLGWIGWSRYLVLPSLSLAGLLIADITRQLRSGLIEAKSEDFVRTARAKGLRESVVLGRHVLRVASGPAISVTAVHAARLFGGSIVVEKLFGLPGLGGLTVEAVLSRDLPLIYGIVPLAVAVAVVFTLLADQLLQVLNPRLRAAHGRA